jgi:hypothetical protein
VNIGSNRPNSVAGASPVRFAHAIALIQLLVGAAIAVLIGYAYRSTGHDFMQYESDAAYFYDAASGQTPEYRFDESLLLNENTLPILVWSRIYLLVDSLGGTPDPIWGILVNAALVLVAQFMTIICAQRQFGFGGREIIGLGFMLASNGLLMMFAGIHMRDSFLLLTTVMSVIAFYPLHKGSAAACEWVKLACLAVLMIIAFLCRTEGIVVPFMIYLASTWVRHGARSPWLRVSMVLTAAGIVLLLVWLDSFSLIVRNYQGYRALAQEESGDSSLAYSLLYNLPFPLSTVASSALLLFVKIPFWRGALADSYALYVSMAAIQMLFVAPTFIALSCYMLFNKADDGTRYLVLTVIALVLMTALTSAQVRHVAVMYPFLLLLYTMRNRIMIGPGRAYYLVSRYALGGAVLLLGLLVELR